MMAKRREEERGNRILPKEKAGPITFRHVTYIILADMAIERSKV